MPGNNKAIYPDFQISAFGVPEFFKNFFEKIVFQKPILPSFWEYASNGLKKA